MNLLLDIFLNLHENYHYLQIPQKLKIIKNVIKRGPSIVWLGLGYERVNLSLIKLNNVLRHFVGMCDEYHLPKNSPT